ncbi:phosphatase PAP2 family protein [Millisia brevis]|uniref:phosphatase PAP2 family protein n=1 Tax=Millisia brevis TaxID=264148 RepID=UPI00082D9C63|nr:phosphatase PAP2 family protein [Millisia brevis]
MGGRSAGIGTVLAIPLVAVAVLGLVLAGRGAPFPVDLTVLDAALARRTPDRTIVAERISAVCGYLGMTVIALLAGAVVFVRDRNPRTALAPVVALVAAMAVTEVVKMLVARPRPPIASRLSLTEQTFSYPSGHAAGASACLVAVALVLTRTRPARVVAVACAAVWATVVAGTRVYLGVHWASDVVAGLVLGSALSVLVVTLMVPRPGRVRTAAVSDTACGHRQPDR